MPLYVDNYSLTGIKLDSTDLSSTKTAATVTSLAK